VGCGESCNRVFTLDSLRASTVTPGMSVDNSWHRSSK
jgi:hypothetical protein